MRVLYLDHYFPETDTSAGALRIFELIKILIVQGHHVTFLSRLPQDTRYQTALESIGVVCLCEAESEHAGSARFFEILSRSQTFDAAALVTYYVFNQYEAVLRAFWPQCHLVIDTVDLHFLRMEREAEFYPEIRLKAEAVKMEEAKAIQNADSVWVVTESERTRLQEMGWKQREAVCISPTIHIVPEKVTDYQEREGIVFVGGYKHPPNVDAVKFFMQDIMPLLDTKLPGVKVNIVGSHPPEEFNNYCQQYPNVSILGFVNDHRLLLQACRVGIAPLRFGAGIKGKIGDYLACGLPCVSSRIGVEGMGLLNEQNVLVADNPESFADAIVRLYQDEVLWHKLSRAGRDFIKERYTPEALAPLVVEAMKVCERRPVPNKAVGVRQMLHSLKNIPGPGQLYAKTLFVLKAGGLPELRNRARLWLTKARRTP